MEPHVLRLPNAEDFAEHAEARANLNYRQQQFRRRSFEASRAELLLLYCQLGKEPKSSSTGSSAHVFPAGLSKGNWLCGLCEVKSSGFVSTET